MKRVWKLPLIGIKEKNKLDRISRIFRIIIYFITFLKKVMKLNPLSAERGFFAGDELPALLNSLERQRSVFNFGIS